MFAAKYIVMIWREIYSVLSDESYKPNIDRLLFSKMCGLGLNIKFGQFGNLPERGWSKVGAWLGH